MANAILGRPGMKLLDKDIGKNFEKGVTPVKPHMGKKQQAKAAKRLAKKWDRWANG